MRYNNSLASSFQFCNSEHRQSCSFGSYLENGAQFGERFQVINVNDERSQQIVKGEAEGFQKSVEQRRFDGEEVEEELVFVLTHVNEEGTAGSHQRAVIT